MGVRINSVSSSVVLNSPITTTVETVICTLPPFNTFLDNQQIIVFAECVLNMAASTTSLQARIRQGTTTAGNSITPDAYSLFIGPNNGQAWGMWGFDNPGAVAGMQYSFTMTCGGAAANTGVNEVRMFAFAL